MRSNAAVREGRPLLLQLRLRLRLRLPLLLDSLSVKMAHYQDAVDFVRERLPGGPGVAATPSQLAEICEAVMDRCLAPDPSASRPPYPYTVSATFWLDVPAGLSAFRQPFLTEICVAAGAARQRRRAGSELTT